MQITSLKALNFLNLPEHELQFSPGLTVIKGANEAGKSSILAALKIALWGDAESKSQELKYFKKWTAESMFDISVKLQNGNGAYLLERDFSNRNNVLVLPNGQKIGGKSEIGQIISEKMGLPSEASYLSTACITQDEISMVRDEKGELRKCIENRLVGGDDVNLDRILKTLGDQIADLQKGGVRPGPLKVSEARVGELMVNVQQIENAIDEFKRNKQQLTEKTKKMEKIFQALELKTEQIKKSQKYIKTKEDYDAAKKNHAKLVASLEEREKHSTAVRQLKTDIKELQKRLEGLQKTEQGIREAREIKKNYTKLEKAGIELDETIKNLKSKQQKFSDIVKELNEMGVVKEEDVRNAKVIPREIEGLRSGKEIIAIVKPRITLSALAESDTEKSAEVSLTPGEPWSLSGKVTMRLDVKRVATIDIINKTGAVDKEIARKESELEKILKKYSVEGHEELSSKYGAYRKLEEKKVAVENEINIELRASRVKNITELQRQRKEIQEKLDSEKENLLSYKSSDLSLDEEQAIVKNIKELSDKLEKQKSSCSRLEGILEKIPDEAELKSQKRKTAEECSLLESQLENLQMFSLSPEDYLKLDSEKKELGVEKEKINNEVYHLKEITKREEHSDEELAKKQAELFAEEQNIDHFKNIINRTSILRDALIESREKTIAGIAEVLEGKVAEYIGIITEGKYKKVKVDDELKFRIWSEEKNDWITPSPDLPEASSGLIDQLYFSARFALIDLICSGKKPPILMDDPFIHFDATRARNALAIVEKLAEQYQIIIFTCHDAYSSSKGKLVEL